MRRVTVIDSSALRALSHLKLATKLAVFFDVIYVPRQVQTELNRVGRFRYQLKKLYDSSVFQRCFAGNRTNVILMMDDLDEGEAEGLTQAQEKGANTIILDEEKARRFASNMRIQPIGVARILFRLERDGHIGDATALISKLRNELDFRISPEILREARSRSEEAI